ncbi:MAG: glycogen debranching enzyme, partial [Acidimicrobiales bacterium]
MRAVNLDVSPGRPYPLGATYDGIGTNFSLFAEQADFVEVCLFDDQGREVRLRLPEETAHIHHGFIAGIGPGQRYGFRVDGPYDPARGLFHNRAKLLVDPYARALEGEFTDVPAVDADNAADSAPYVPRSVIIHDA